MSAHGCPAEVEHRTFVRVQGLWLTLTLSVDLVEPNLSSTPRAAQPKISFSARRVSLTLMANESSSERRRTSLFQDPTARTGADGLKRTLETESVGGWTSSGSAGGLPKEDIRREEPSRGTSRGWTRYGTRRPFGKEGVGAAGRLKGKEKERSRERGVGRLRAAYVT